ncbi:hypothetical protein TNCV_3311861 [Trichonephila clavipes]|nr:hypothetical protein TNCV_3311861 [Trichonephila clavipes]
MSEWVAFLPFTSGSRRKVKEPLQFSFQGLATALVSSAELGLGGSKPEFAGAPNVLRYATVEIDNGAAILKSLLHSNDNEGRRFTRCIEVLPTIPHSVLDTSAVTKNWKGKLQKSFCFFTYPRV